MNQVTPQEKTLKDKTAKGLLWGGISYGSVQIIQVVFGIIMMRILSPDEFGIVGLLLIFAVVSQTIQESGFVTALINKKNIQHEDYNAVFWFNVVIGFLLYICLFFSAPFLANFYGRSILIPISRVLFLNFLIGGLGIAQHAYISKNLLVKEKAKIEILASLFSGLIGICLALLKFSYWAIVIQNVLYYFIAVIIRWYYSPWRPSLNINYRPLKDMLSFSIKLLITSLLAKISENIFSVFLGKNYSNEMVGHYSQGNKWSMMGGAFISGMISYIALPVLTQICDDPERQKNAFRKMLRFGAFISFPILLGLAFVSKEFLIIVGNGDKWIPTVPYLQLFCTWNAVLYIYLLYTNLILSHNKSAIYMWGSICTAIVQLIAILIVFKFGIFQTIIAFISVNFFSLIFWHFHTNKIIGLKILHVIKDILPYLMVIIGCILFTWLITKNIDNLYLRFFSKIIVTATLYGIIMWKSNSVIAREAYTFLKEKIVISKKM